jgi:dCMP deaminase
VKNTFYSHPIIFIPVILLPEKRNCPKRFFFLCLQYPLYNAKIQLVRICKKITEGWLMERRDKINYYLDIAETVSKRSTCLRRIYGAVIVNNDEIVSTGYVGAPRGRKNCCDLGYCLRSKLSIPRGERYEMCRSVHAEANAIISAPRDKMMGARLYLVGFEIPSMEYIKEANSCSMCKRMIINAGIDKVVIRDTKDDYRIINVRDWIDNDETLDGKTGY